MDPKKYEDFKYAVIYGGFPSIKNETFTEAQVKELKGILTERSNQSLEYSNSLKAEKAEKEKTDK